MTTNPVAETINDIFNEGLSKRRCTEEFCVFVMEEMMKHNPKIENVNNFGKVYRLAKRIIYERKPCTIQSGASRTITRYIGNRSSGFSFHGSDLPLTVANLFARDVGFDPSPYANTALHVARRELTAGKIEPVEAMYALLFG